MKIKRILEGCGSYSGHGKMIIMNSRTYKFQSVIQKVPDQDKAYIVFPFDVEKEFGRKRVAVHASFGGEPYDGSIVNMGLKNSDGSVCYIIGVKKDIYAKINKQFGDVINVIIKER